MTRLREIRRPWLRQPNNETHRLSFRDGPILGYWGAGFGSGITNIATQRAGGTAGAYTLKNSNHGIVASSTTSAEVVSGQPLESAAWSSSDAQRTLVLFGRPTDFSNTYGALYAGALAANDGFRTCGVGFGNGNVGRAYGTVDATVTDASLNSSFREDTSANWPYCLLALVLDGATASFYVLPYKEGGAFADESASAAWSGTVGGKLINVGAYNRNGTVTRTGVDIVGAAVLGYAASAAQLDRMRTSRMGSLFAPRRIFVPMSAGVSVPTLSAATYMPGSLTSTGFRPRVTAS